ncbi:MAG: TrkH family potassium uptake protein [Candidatus Omnitrophica bacterium]|nr:TrkH family potassium uptake protein [Candidatus Omnitrophota bacterium]MBU4478233.1 TrkH family potassium uptake protein [Candidatus Omnitrophota bacterium]MCG2703300.1 TrkH family potassium uptake protein [Candidatus Omnitrophota bacterium]
MLLLKSRLQDLKIISYYLGKIFIAVGVCMLAPMALSFFLAEYSVVYDFVIGFSLSLLLGYSLLTLCKTEEDLTWTQGMVTVALTWLIAALLGAVPLFLSGHYRCFLDAYFEAMSGFSTTGLSLIQDLDHLSFGHNLWRHLMMFMGGQGIVVFALSFFVSGASGAFRLYVGEGRDERVLPNVISTARFIWGLSLLYFIIGSLVLTLIGLKNGLPLGISIFDGVCLFMAAFDTGGFTPHSQSILFYHSRAFEAATVIIMVLGALNFKLHYELWMGNRQELKKNIEVIAFSLSVLLIFTLLSIYFVMSGTYLHKGGLFFKGFYQLISAHTGTGYQTVYNGQIANEWGDFALIMMIIAMGLGGGICSTTGGIKMLRLGVIWSGLSLDINKLLLPESSVLVKKIHHIKEIVLEPKLVQSSFIITFCFLILYVFGALVGAFLGYPFLPALFESTSAAANVGLSCGITCADMPVLLKLTYIFQMWAGRLEFISIFILAGFTVAFIKGK